MTTARIVQPTVAARTDPSPARESARISFRQPVSTSGYIDAAWWPRSLDLTAELPALLDTLWTAGREINRITYNQRAWKPAPRTMQVEGHTVRLGGFTTSDPLTVRLSDPWGRDRIDVLVVAPTTDPAVAERALMIASQQDSRARAAEVLAQARDAVDRPG